jgi:hypothetical protein
VVVVHSPSRAAGIWQSAFLQQFLQVAGQSFSLFSCDRDPLDLFVGEFNPAIDQSNDP